MRRAHKTDLNQARVFSAWDDIPGVEYADTSALGNGNPDAMLISSGNRGWLVEIKDGPKPLTPKEAAFAAKHPAHYVVVETVTDAVNLALDVMWPHRCPRCYRLRVEPKGGMAVCSECDAADGSVKCGRCG